MVKWKTPFLTLHVFVIIFFVWFKYIFVMFADLGELKASDRVANVVQGRGPESHAHHVRHNQQDRPTHARLGW